MYLGWLPEVYAMTPTLQYGVQKQDTVSFVSYGLAYQIYVYVSACTRFSSVFPLSPRWFLVAQVFSVVRCFSPCVGCHGQYLPIWKLASSAKGFGCTTPLFVCSILSLR